MHSIKKEVLNAANQFKSGMDYELSYKLNRLQGPSKKSASVAKIKNYNLYWTFIFFSHYSDLTIETPFLFYISHSLWCFIIYLFGKWAECKTNLSRSRTSTSTKLTRLPCVWKSRDKWWTGRSISKPNTSDSWTLKLITPLKNWTSCKQNWENYSRQMVY